MKVDDKQFKIIFTDMIGKKLGLYRAIAIKIVNSSADAADAVQAALFKGWVKRNDFISDTADFSGNVVISRSDVSTLVLDVELTVNKRRVRTVIPVVRQNANCYISDALS